MNTSYQLFIDGVWREGSDGTKVPVINPATEEAFAEVSWGTPEDANLALAAAEKALAEAVNGQPGVRPAGAVFCFL